MGVPPFNIATAMHPDHRAAPGKAPVQEVQGTRDDIPQEALIEEGFTES